jgi:rhodanese-related sulfurtransferase
MRCIDVHEDDPRCRRARSATPTGLERATSQDNNSTMSCIRCSLGVVAVIAAFTGACSKSDSTAKPPPASTTPAGKDPATARALITAGAVVVDVRTPDEFAQGHLPTAVNLPIQTFSSRLAEVATLVGDDKARPIVVYCAAGARAAQAKAQLEAAGYSRVVNGGGVDDLR